MSNEEHDSSARKFLSKLREIDEENIANLADFFEEYMNNLSDFNRGDFDWKDTVTESLSDEVKFVAHHSMMLGFVTARDTATLYAFRNHQVEPPERPVTTELTTSNPDSRGDIEFTLISDAETAAQLAGIDETEDATSGLQQSPECSVVEVEGPASSLATQADSMRASSDIELAHGVADNAEAIGEAYKNDAVDEIDLQHFSSDVQSVQVTSVLFGIIWEYEEPVLYISYNPKEDTLKLTTSEEQATSHANGNSDLVVQPEFSNSASDVSHLGS